MHYINSCGNSEFRTFSASASSGVVSGLQEGQQYQFSVSVSLLINGLIYTSAPGEPVNATVYSKSLFSTSLHKKLKVYALDFECLSKCCLSYDMIFLCSALIFFCLINVHTITQILQPQHCCQPSQHLQLDALVLLVVLLLQQLLSQLLIHHQSHQ